MTTQQTLLSVSPLSIYEEMIGPIRDSFQRNSVLTTQLLNPTIDPKLLELFLIYFNGIGVSITMPVADWIRRAGEKCLAIGLLELGQELISHSKQESGHHQMMESDTRNLVTQWNLRQPLKLNPASIFAKSSTTGTRLYFHLHEEVIASTRPYRQLAIDFENNLLWQTYGCQLLMLCWQLLGDRILAGLSFTKEQVVADLDHTKFIRLQMERLLTVHPEFADDLFRTGEASLYAYDLFLSDCLKAAANTLSGSSAELTAKR